MFCPPPPLVFYGPEANFFGGMAEFFFPHPDENILPSPSKNWIMHLMNVIVDTPLDYTLLQTPVFEFN